MNETRVDGLRYVYGVDVDVALANRDAEIAALRQQVAELQAYKQRVIDADKRVIRKVIDEEVDD